MKTLCFLIALLSVSHVSFARAVTLLVGKTNLEARVTLQPFETARLVSVRDGWAEYSSGFYGAIRLIVEKEGFVYVEGGRDLADANVLTPIIVTGPATLILRSDVTDRADGHAAFATFEITPEFFQPDKTLIALPGTNAVTVTLECSTNLLNWSTATNGLYTNLPEAKFFRIRAERSP